MKVSGKIVPQVQAKNKRKGFIPDFEKQNYSPEDLDEKIQEYFDSKEEEIVNVTIKGKPVQKKMKIYTLPGLALYIGMTGTQQYKEYMKDTKSKLSKSLKKGYSKLHEYLETQLIKTNNSNPIFILKNMDYSDQQTVNNVSTDGSMSPKPVILPATSDHKETGKQVKRMFSELAEQN